MCGVPTLIWISNQVPSNRMCGVPPPLPASQTSYDFVRCLTLVWTSDQITQIEMCSVPPPPNYQTYYHFGCQSTSTCISKFGTPSWACFKYYLAQGVQSSSHLKSTYIMGFCKICFIGFHIYGLKFYYTAFLSSECPKIIQTPGIV